MNDSSGQPAALTVLESVLYCDDLSAAEAFYREVLGLAFVSRRPGRHVFFRAGGSMVLIFNAAATSAGPTVVSGQDVPAHGARGAGHLAFRLAEPAFQAWRHRLEARGVAIESEVCWPGGGRSLYFRDPAGNSLELATAD